MDKYINKLVRGFRKIFNKKYVAVVSIFVGLIAVLGFTYGYLSDESGWQLAYQLRASELYYTMTIDGNSVSTITAPANSTTYHDIVITSLNDVNTRYSLTYASDSVTVSVTASSNSVNRQEGIIGLYTTGTTAEKTKTIRIAITNTGGVAKVTFNVAGGYTWNPENEVAILDGYNRITGLIAESNMQYGLTLAQEVSSLLNCTPTSTMPCLFKENANNYLTLNGQTWRIIGSYLIGTENVVKLILNSNYETLATYGNRGTVYTAILLAMSSQAKALLRSSSPFACTGTSTITCSGGNGTVNSISKVEYNLIGGVNSYLYTKPGENYWTYDSRYAATSRGISGKLSTTVEAYVRPAVYLRENVVRVSGDGSQEQPYVVTMGYHLTINGVTNATTNLSDGYYASGQAYVLDTPVHSDSDYFFNGWLVSGTGASVSGTTFTMGTADTTLTATWGKEFNYNGSYGTFTADTSGYYYIEAYGAQGGDVTTASNATGLTYAGGKGGFTSGYVELDAGDELYFYIGGQGTATSQTASQTATGGYNGGGDGLNGAAGTIATSGGGATDIRYFGSTTPTSNDLDWNSSLGLRSRIMVAGGGGGAYSCITCANDIHGIGGFGGNLTGGSGKGINAGTSVSATGGTQTSTSFGQGVNGTSDKPGGGGGYYGGNTGSYTAGGGSSFISGYTGCNAVNSSGTHTGSANHYSSLTFEKGKMTSEVRSGNGYAKIMYEGSTIPNYPLYDVLKTLAQAGNYATTYSGLSNDTYGETGTNTIYYAKPKSSTYVNDLLNKINVKFGGFCWQMFRTTDSGGVKLIYNGDPDSSGNCQSITVDNPHTGVVASTTGTYTMNSGTTFKYSDSFTYSGTTFTLVDPVSDNYYTNKNLIGKYTCLNNTTPSTCPTLYQISTPNGASVNKPYTAQYTITTDTHNSQIGTSPFSASNRSTAFIGYKYGTSYDFGANSAPDSGVIMGNTVYWNGQNYELRESDGTTPSRGTDYDDTHHYTCNTQLATCTGGTVRYYHYNNYYTLLKNGDTISTALTTMLTENKYKSTMMAYIENWYLNELKNSSTSIYIDEKAIYCNDRSINSLGGWSKDSATSTTLQFYNATNSRTSLGCTNVTDRFSVNNTSAQINYPIGLPTTPEMVNIGNNTIRNTGQIYRTMSPYQYNNGYRVSLRTVNATGAVTGSGYANALYGVRPVITLAPMGGVKFKGDGSYNNPYEIDTN